MHYCMLPHIVEVKRKVSFSSVTSTRTVLVALHEFNSMRVQTENPTQLNSGGAELYIFSDELYEPTKS